MVFVDLCVNLFMNISVLYVLQHTMCKVHLYLSAV